MRHSSPGAVSLLLFVVGLTAVGGMPVPSANAWEFGPGANVADAPTSISASSAAAQKKGSSAARATAVDYSLNYSPVRRYFVEFRARNAASYGHMYVMYGEANERHEVVRSEIAGFFPAGDRRDCVNCSVYYWTIGHVLPVPSEIGASDGDLEEQYVLARFRVWIDAAQYKRLVAYIKARKANRGPWNAFLNNCVTFGRDVAVFLNVKMPLLASLSPTVVTYPQQLVEAMAKANGVYKDQGALRDAASSLPVKVSTQKAAADNAEKATAEKAAVEQAVPAASSSRQEEGKLEASALH
jgi:hypothetical protein